MNSLRSIRDRYRTLSADESGFGLVEVLVSAFLVIVTTVATLSMVDASSRASTEERHYTRAYGIAQDDQARLRSLKISELSNIRQTRNIAQDKITYTVQSKGEFVTDSTGTASCTQTSSADYIKITSSVTWSTMGNKDPVVLQSIVAPPSGSVAADHGALAIAIQTGHGDGVPNLTVNGSGPESFSGTTNENGCVIFGDLPEGDYEITPTLGSGLVNKDGLTPTAETVSVVGLATNTVVLQYDLPGQVNVDFTTKVGSTIVPAQADSVVFFNTGMTEEKAFGSVGTLVSQIQAKPLFPFSSPDTVYAGACSINNPNPEADDDAPGAAATADVTVPAGGTASATVRMPALHLKVWSGSSSSSPGTAVNNARVIVRDQNCLINGVQVARTLKTGADGFITNRGLPWGVYTVCADSANKRRSASNVTVQDMNVGTTLNIYVGGGTTGICT